MFLPKYKQAKPLYFVVLCTLLYFFLYFLRSSRGSVWWPRFARQTRVLLMNSRKQQAPETKALNDNLYFDSLKYAWFPVRVSCQCMQKAAIILNRIQCPSAYCPHRRAVKLKPSGEGFWHYELDMFEEAEYLNQFRSNQLPEFEYFRKRGISPRTETTSSRQHETTSNMETDEFGFDEFE